jgi:hypothetical protein
LFPAGRVRQAVAFGINGSTGASIAKTACAVPSASKGLAIVIAAHTSVTFRT